VGEDISDRVDYLLDHYGPEIEARNRMDQQLYDHTIKHVIPRHNSSYGSGLESDLAQFRLINGEFRLGPRDYIDFAVRKLYYEPVSGAYRRMNGLPAAGAYSRKAQPQFFARARNCYQGEDARRH